MPSLLLEIKTFCLVKVSRKKKEATQLIVHHTSITLPSHLHRISIETMDYRWIIDGGRAEFLAGKNHVNGMDNQDRENK